MSDLNNEVTQDANLLFAKAGMTQLPRRVRVEEDLEDGLKKKKYSIR